MEIFFVHKGIEELPKFWKIEGVLLLVMLAVSLLSFALISVVPGMIGKLIILVVTIALIVIFRSISQKTGIKGVKKKIGARKQPDIIIVTKPHLQHDAKDIR